MENTIRIQLKKDSKSPESTILRPELVKAGNMDCEEIISELIKDGLLIDSKLALEIIMQFNRKASELVASGYHVNTGLVSLKPEIKGLIYGQRWNAQVNKIDVSFNGGNELLHTISQTQVEIMTEYIDVDTINISNEQSSIEKGLALASRLNENYLTTNNETPACGIAFRRWLSKA
jgi:hypothetical protein